MDRLDADDGSYVDFLQDQVRRLNAILKEYQRRYMPIPEPDEQDYEPGPPWLMDKNILTPMLKEYDENIKILKKQVNHYKTEHGKIKDSADRIIHENERLHEELRQNIELQLRALQDAEGTSGFNQDALDNLQEQLNLIGNERENYKSLWERSCAEVRDLQTSLEVKAQEVLSRTNDMAILQGDLQKARKYAETLQRINNKMKLEHEEYLQSAQLQDREVETSRGELRRCRTEMKTMKLKNEELSNHLDRLQAQMKLFDQDNQRVSLAEKTSENTIAQLQNAIIELESRVASFSKEIGRLRGERNELEETVATLQRKYQELEEKAYQASLEVRDSAQTAENALLEKEQSAVREQQTLQEMKRVQNSLRAILKDAERRKLEEIESLKHLHHEQVARLTEEMQYLEMEGAERQAQFERVIREKASIEKELEKVYQEGPMEATRAGLTYEELQKKLLRSEVAKDELQIEIDQLRSAQRRSETQHSNDITFLKSQIDEAAKRINVLQDEVEKTSGSRMNLVDEIDKLKRNLDTAVLSKNELEIKYAAKVAALEQQVEIKERDCESRAKATDEMSRKTISELREMLSAQQRIGTKWKEESKTMSHKYEGTLSELSNEVSRLRKKNEEIVKRLSDEMERSDKLEQDLLSQNSAQERLQRISADAEARADAASAQVQTLLNRERQLLQERKELNLHIDRLKLEGTRNETRPAAGNRPWTESILENRTQSPTMTARYPRFNIESP